jgi:hypothetical protein
MLHIFQQRITNTLNCENEKQLSDSCLSKEAKYKPIFYMTVFFPDVSLNFSTSTLAHSNED